MNSNIRVATDEDVEQIEALNRIVYGIGNYIDKAQFLEYIGDESYFYVSHLENGFMNGFIYAFPLSWAKAESKSLKINLPENDNRLMFVGNIVVLENSRRTGLASKLYKKLFLDLGRDEKKGLFATVAHAPMNLPSANLHLKLGFQMQKEFINSIQRKFGIYYKKL